MLHPEMLQNVHAGVKLMYKAYREAMEEEHEGAIRGAGPV
jgi:hypothetical protein